MNIGGTQVVAGFTVTMTLAPHSSSYQVKGQPMYAGNPAGYVLLRAGSATFYHTGDTDIFSDMRLIAALHAPRIVALPIGGHYTMGPRAAAMAIEMLRPNCVIPMHYGTWPQLPGRQWIFGASCRCAVCRRWRCWRWSRGTRRHGAWGSAGERRSLTRVAGHG